VNTSLSVRTSARSPLAVAVLFIGIAVFAIVAIVRATINTDSDIDTTTTAGLAAVKAPAMSNNIADALPAFSLQTPAEALPEFYPPEAQSQTHPAQMTEEEYAGALGAPEFKVIDGNPWIGIAPETNLAGSGWYPCSAVITTGFPEAFRKQALAGCGLTYTAPAHDTAWDNREWLAVAYGPGETKWVYGGAWFDCRHVNPDVLTYATVGGDPALVVWGELAPRKQSDIAKECGQ
jgi:hypothetical protein